MSFHRYVSQKKLNEWEFGEVAEDSDVKKYLKGKECVPFQTFCVL